MTDQPASQFCFDVFMPQNLGGLGARICCIFTTPNVRAEATCGRRPLSSNVRPQQQPMCSKRVTTTAGSGQGIAPWEPAPSTKRTRRSAGTELVAFNGRGARTSNVGGVRRALCKTFRFCTAERVQGQRGPPNARPYPAARHVWPPRGAKVGRESAQVRLQNFQRATQVSARGRGGRVPPEGDKSFYSVHTSRRARKLRSNPSLERRPHLAGRPSSNVRRRQNRPGSRSGAEPIPGCGKLRTSEATWVGGANMELTLDALQAEVLKLPAADRVRLLDVLLDSIDEDEEVEREWERVADERDAELESGAVSAVDGPTVLARLRAKYGA